MIGQTISHYKILEKLGEGGMGVVYKAQDTKLDRLVALKFLPHHISANEAEKARFLQEAKAAAALNHPNICTIHGIEEDGNEQFIVMEFVDGVTLREKFAETRISVKEAMTYAVQIGEALEEAHGRGIVHRDIKSDNIMLNRKNQIKVMDFGLAKLKGSLKLTKATSTVGTLSYMSPEQIQGRETDGRSDIFSCGIVLFEMLTGRLPFRGEHDAAMMYSIVNEEPESIQQSVPDVSSELVHVLNTALEKQPEDRYQAIGEMVRDLRRAQKQTSRVSRIMEASQLAATQEPSGVGEKSASRALYLSGAAAILVLIAAILYIFLRPSVELNPNMTVRVLEIPFTEMQYPGLSPDGKWLAFPAGDANGTWDIYNMYVTGGEPKRITSDSSLFQVYEYNANVSPDGSLIAYNLLNRKTGKNEVRIVSSLGGPSKVVSEIGAMVKWRPDGERIGYGRIGSDSNIPAVSRWKELWSVKADGADRKLEFVDTLGEASGGYSFSWSADGKSVAWLRTFKDKTQEVIIRELATGKERQLTFEKKHIDEVCWTSNDRIIYASDKSGTANLWMVPANGGESVQITKEGPDFGITLSADSKRMVFYRRRTVGYVWRAGISAGYAKQLTFENRRVGNASFSPDRQQIVFAGGTDEFGLNFGIYLMDRDGNNRREVVPQNGPNSNPFWSPDGKWIAYSAGGGGISDSSNVFLIDAINPGSPRQITKGQISIWADTRSLLVRRGSRNWQIDIFSKDEVPLFEDSTFAYPVLGQQYLLYNDFRFSSRGVWIIPSNYKTHPSAKPKLLYSPDESLAITLSEDRSMHLLWDDKGNLWKMLLPSGRREQIAGHFPGLTRRSSVNTSHDNKEIVYIQRRLDTKFVLIDNLFK